MAKRRNLKKEKAYARQFRKKFSRYSSRNKRFERSNYNRDGEQLASETKSETKTNS